MGIETIALAGGSLISSALGARSQRRAADRAADAAQDSADAQIALARETRDGQIARSEPFRQLELQQGNALGEIFGFNSVGDITPQQASANGVNIEAQDAARARFEGSMFNDVYRAGHGRDVDRIDAGLGASGLAFSGARLQAVEDARADRFGSTFNSYLSGLMGQAPQSATQSQNSAAGNFGANAASAIAANGLAQQNSAYQRGQANAGLWDGISSLGSSAGLGGITSPKP